MVSVHRSRQNPQLLRVLHGGARRHGLVVKVETATRRAGQVPRGRLEDRRQGRRGGGCCGRAQRHGGVMLLVLGGLLGLAGAWLAVSRHLAKIEPR